MFRRKRDRSAFAGRNSYLQVYILCFCNQTSAYVSRFLEKKYDEARKGTDPEESLDAESTSESGKEKKSGLDHVPTIILRMRQTTVHPYLLESSISQELTKEEIQELIKGLEGLKDQSAVGDMVSSWSPTTAGLGMDGRLEKAFVQKGCTLCSFCGCEASNPQIADVSQGNIQSAALLTRLSSARIHSATTVWKRQWLPPRFPRIHFSNAPTVVR